MVSHTPHLEKAQKQGEMPLPILSPIPSLHFMNGMERGWVMAFFAYSFSRMVGHRYSCIAVLRSRHDPLLRRTALS